MSDLNPRDELLKYAAAAVRMARDELGPEAHHTLIEYHAVQVLDEIMPDDVRERLTPDFARHVRPGDGSNDDALLLMKWKAYRDVLDRA